MPSASSVDIPLPFPVSTLPQGILDALKLTSVAAKRRESDNFQNHPDAGKKGKAVPVTGRESP
jgi:hypothetical protein